MAGTSRDQTAEREEAYSDLTGAQAFIGFIEALRDGYE